MADFADFPEREYNVFQICRSFKPPFYVRTVSGLYDKDEDSCYSAGQVYAILHKLRIKSVIATVRGTSFKIPLDYEGQFSIVGQPHSGSLTMREITETVTPQDLPQEVRLSNSPQKHGKHFLEMLDKIGRGIRTCNLTLSQEIMDEYFIGRSPDRKLMIVFPGDAFMNFQVKKTNIQDVQHLLFNVKELKYDIFVTCANKPAAKFLTTEEAMYSSPKRPPKPVPSVRRKVSPTSAPGGKDVQILLCSQPPPTPPKKSPTDFVRKKPPPIPPLHSYPISDEERDTDEDYDEKVSGISHSPRGLPVTPPAFPLSPSARQKVSTPPLHPHPGGGRDTNDEYDGRMRGAVGNITESTVHYDSDDIGSDYESPLSADDYEQVEPPPDDFQSTRSPPIPTPTRSPGAAKTQNSPKTGFAKTPDSPNRRPPQIDKIRQQLNIQIRKFSKFGKKERSDDRTGDMADDELTEDPYAEQQQEQRKSTKKRIRRRDDPLPMPLSPGPSSASMSSSLPPPLPPPSSTARPRAAPPVPDSDSDSLSDYEKIDDDIPVQSTGGPRLPPGVSTFPSNYPQPNQPSKLSLPGYRQPLQVSLPPLPRVPDEGSTKPSPHASGTSGRSGNVAVVKPASKQQQPPPAATDEFPSDLCKLGVEAITQTLRKLNMPEEIIANFREAQIDGQIFVCLDDTILDELGVRKLDKLKIIKFKNGWRPNLR